MALRDIMQEYERIRMQERQALQKRKEHAAALHAGFAVLAKKRGETAAAFVEAIQKGVASKAAIEEAERTLSLLDQEEQTLLKQVGLPPDYLQLQARCPLCMDTGYVGDPRRKHCVCLHKMLLERQKFSSQIHPDETFERFDEGVYPSEEQRRRMVKYKRLLEQFADRIPETDRHNLVLTGESGLGKTFFLNCIAERVLSRGIGIKKLTAYTLNEQILSGIRQNADVSLGFIEAPLLLIDDLGAEPMLNNITREYIFSILNERRNGKKHTVVATNLGMEELQERYGERVFSRLISSNDALVIELTGQNLRLRQL